MSRGGDPIHRAVHQLARLPGVGEKTATRLVYWLLRAPSGTAAEIGAALSALGGSIAECFVCANFTTRLTDADLARCPICADAARDLSTICVVEHPQDVLAFERAQHYRGQYHVLHGAISPQSGVTPDRLRIRALLERLRTPGVTEVILATDSDIEGDTTALYLSRLLHDLPIRITRIAQGMSVGTEIEFADSRSLARAIDHRRDFR